MRTAGLELFRWGRSSVLSTQRVAPRRIGRSQSCRRVLPALGFISASNGGLGSPDPSWGEHFQVRTFGAQLIGRLRYVAPFQDV